MTQQRPNPTSVNTGEETLRLIAGLASPAGLEDRIHERMRSTPSKGRLIAWPTRFNPQDSWMRTAAAAAIVVIVAGGGWGVYTRLGQHQPEKVIATPQRAIVPGGFGSAGAMRTPNTLPGPAAPKAKKLPKNERKSHGNPSKATTNPHASSAQ